MYTRIQFVSDTIKGNGHCKKKCFWLQLSSLHRSFVEGGLLIGNKSFSCLLWIWRVAGRQGHESTNRFMGAFTNHFDKILPVLTTYLQLTEFLYCYRGKSAYCWHFQYHLPTSSCKRSLWTPLFRLEMETTKSRRLCYSTRRPRLPDNCLLYCHFRMG